MWHLFHRYEVVSVYSGIKWERLKSDAGKPEDLTGMEVNGANYRIVGLKGNYTSQQDVESIHIRVFVRVCVCVCAI